MWIRRALVLAATVPFFAACALPWSSPGQPSSGGGASAAPIPSEAADQPTPAADPPDGDFPTPHRGFRTHFTDPLYEDPADDLAPFGSDEGADTLAEWTDRRSELTGCTTVRWMIEQDDEAGALDHPERNGPDVDGFLIGAGFSLLLFTGHIDSEGRRLVLDALQRTYAYYADSEPREPAVMARDLERFLPTDCTPPR